MLYRYLLDRHHCIYLQCSRLLKRHCHGIDNGWAAMIGLEIHAQIASNTKLFSRAGSQANLEPNDSVDIFDSAQPGTLPVLNKRCVEAGVLTALALNCTINSVSHFDRKHYFYFDLPAGYQITQHRHPIAENGYIDYYVNPPLKGVIPYKKRTKIERIQLEQDSGRSYHEASKERTLVDLNRAGVGLMEIVTEPNLKDGMEAQCLVEALQLLLRALNTCEGHMEQSQLRVDANISVHRPGTPPGTRTEVKNLNSFKYIQKAVDFEITRQIEILEDDKEIINETRYFDSKFGTTYSLRDKEGFHDYRYMPEPNLPPLRINTDTTSPPPDASKNAINVDSLKSQIPELPLAKLERWVASGADLRLTILIMNDPVWGPFVEAAVEEFSCPPSHAFDFAWNEARAAYSERRIKFKSSRLTPALFTEAISFYHRKQITRPAMQKLFGFLAKKNVTVSEAIAENKWSIISDRNEILEICRTVCSENPHNVKEFKAKAGKAKQQDRILQQMTQKALYKCNFNIEVEELNSTFREVMS